MLSGSYVEQPFCFHCSVLGYSTEGSSHASHHPQETVHCLQRDYFSLYGSHPKMDDRIYSTCGICEQVFNPQSVASHKEHCAGKSKIPTQHIKKKVKTKKKVQSSSLPLPPLFNVSYYQKLLVFYETISFRRSHLVLLFSQNSQILLLALLKSHKMSTHTQNQLVPL